MRRAFGGVYLCGFLADAQGAPRTQLTLLHGVTLTKKAEMAMKPMKARIDQPTRPRKTPQAMSLTFILMRVLGLGRRAAVGSMWASLAGGSTLSRGGPPFRGLTGMEYHRIPGLSPTPKRTTQVGCSG